MDHQQYYCYSRADMIPCSAENELNNWASGAMGDQQVHSVITRELVNEVRDRLRHIYLDMRRLVPDTREHELMMECVREAITPHLPFSVDKMDEVVDEAYALYLNFLAVEKTK